MEGKEKGGSRERGCQPVLAICLANTHLFGNMKSMLSNKATYAKSSESLGEDYPSCSTTKINLTKTL